jgi:hypothetical protein
MTEVQGWDVWHAACVVRPEFVRIQKQATIRNKEKKMGSKTNRLSPNLEMALAELEEQVDLGVKFVPMQPSLAMIQAGARAGGIDEALAAKIYRAMLEADTLEDTEVFPGMRAN